jgi:nucleoside-diphosphate-sugar epimerase
MHDRLWHIVDVRDVADALLLVYEKAESSGRYISAPNYTNTKAMLELLKKTYPNYNYVKWCVSYHAFLFLSNVANVTFCLERPCLFYAL